MPSKTKGSPVKKKKFTPIGRFGPRFQSPTWGQVQKTAETVIELLGGQEGAANKLSWEHFYTITVLKSLNLDEAKASKFIFGKEWLE